MHKQYECDDPAICPVCNPYNRWAYAHEYEYYEIVRLATINGITNWHQVDKEIASKIRTNNEI